MFINTHILQPIRYKIYDFMWMEVYHQIQSICKKCVPINIIANIIAESQNIAFSKPRTITSRHRLKCMSIAAASRRTYASQREPSSKHLVMCLNGNMYSWRKYTNMVLCQKP